MSTMKRWNVEILIGEVDDQTYAEAQLYDEIRNDLIGTGRAILKPNEVSVPDIGDEIATARALSDLGHRLLVAAAGDLEEATRQQVHLSH